MAAKKTKKGGKISGMALCYHLGDDTEKGRKLHRVLDEMGVKVKEIGEEQLLQTVGYLAGTEGFEAVDEVFSGAAPDCELLLMKGFADPRLTELFTRMRKAEVGRIERKAVVTETNRGWTLLHLIEEISREHEQMNGARDEEPES